MKYIHCIWLQAIHNEPIIMVSEVDDDGYESRRVELFRSGQIGWSGEDGSTFGVVSNAYQVAIENYDAEDGFLATEITKEDFENHWKLAHLKKEKS